MAAPVRAFLAIQPPGDVRGSLANALREVEIDGARLRLVEEDNIHLTIEFLGNIPEELIEPLGRKLDELAGQTDPVEVEIVGISAFPARRPLVIAAVLAENDALSDLVMRVRHRIADIGLEPETRPFRPHITLARIKRGRQKVERFSQPSGLTFTADELVLFRSDLTRQGARYTRLHSASLKR